MLASGFTAAPVSQCFFFGIIASSILVSITDTKYLFYIQVVPHLWRYKQVWRLLTWQVFSPHSNCVLTTQYIVYIGTSSDFKNSQACYTNSTELLFAAMTIYQVRIIERLWGSRKFAVHSLPPTQRVAMT